MKQYEILTGKNPAQLAAKVRDLVAQGWRPHGGPFVVGKDVCQAVVR